MYVQAKNLGGLGETSIDWNSIIKDVVGGYAAVKSVQTQASLTKLQLQQAQQAQNAAIAASYPPVNYALNPQYSGTYGTPQKSSSSLMPVLLLGGAAVVLFMIMKG